MSDRSVYIPGPETVLDLAASIYGALSIAERCDTISETKQHITFAKERAEQLMKKVEDEE